MEIWTTGLPMTVALSVVAAIGYLFGRSRQSEIDPLANTPRRELHRARIVATHLEAIAEQLRKGLASHHASVQRFQQRILQLKEESNSNSMQALRDEAEDILKPTLRLATEIADAYNQIRSQTGNLMAFAKVRTDPLTGVGNRHALDDSLGMMFATMARTKRPFSLAVFEVDLVALADEHHKRSQPDGLLREVAGRINDAVRETDIVTRYGGKEFVVVLPHTELQGASICANRVRNSVHKLLKLKLRVGVVQAEVGDNGADLLARADKALYVAKAADPNGTAVHNTRHTRAAYADSSVLPV